MTQRFNSRRLPASLGALVVGATMVMASVPAAHAAPQDFGNIDADRTGSLTVHKYLHQSGSVEGDISQAPADGTFSNPVKDVEFTVYPLLKDGDPLDLTVPSAWEGLDTLTPGPACTAPSGFTLGTGIVMPKTDAAGTAEIKLPLGFYQVCETDAPASIVDIAPPFLLTVPMPHEKGWVYDVHAYPKNGETSVTKDIKAQDGFGLGASVQFPVTNVIPRMEATTWTGYALRDTVDARLTPNAATTGISSVTVDGVALDSSYYTKTIEGQTITMNFTQAGLDWLNADPSKAGKKIEVVFDTIITEVGDGTITNDADLWVNNPTFDPEGENPPIPSNEVKTYWGNAELIKRAAGTSGEQGLLKGAEFEIYAATDPYAATCDAAVAAGNPISINGTTTFTSNENGVISFPGLFVSDSENPVQDSEYRCYVIREIKAPAGYVLPDNADTAITVTIGQTTTTAHPEIVNTQQEVPELPLTGAAGKVLLTLGGVSAAAIVVGLMLVNRRRTHSA